MNELYGLYRSKLIMNSLLEFNNIELNFKFFNKREYGLKDNFIFASKAFPTKESKYITGKDIREAKERLSLSYDLVTEAIKNREFKNFSLNAGSNLVTLIPISKVFLNFLTKNNLSFKSPKNNSPHQYHHAIALHTLAHIEYHHGKSSNGTYMSKGSVLSLVDLLVSPKIENIHLGKSKGSERRIVIYSNKNDKKQIKIVEIVSNRKKELIVVGGFYVEKRTRPLDVTKSPLAERPKRERGFSISIENNFLMVNKVYFVFGYIKPI